MPRISNYDKTPIVAVSSSSQRDVEKGWCAIAERLRGEVRRHPFVICVECYPGCFEQEIERELVDRLHPAAIVRAANCYLPEPEIRALCEHDLGDDPVFGRMNQYQVSDFLDRSELGKAREQIGSSAGLVLVIGTGASLIAGRWDLLVYADMARWEIQMRQRVGAATNLALRNADERPPLKYKRAFFVDWRAADRLKKTLFTQIDYLLDTNDSKAPKMIRGTDFLRGLRTAAERPFRVVPFFDPGPWGGQWMKEVCALPGDQPNYAWCFDCVPEENSLLLGFGNVAVEVPAVDLVFRHPRELLGDAVHRRFGTEFPIRFDFLDTMGGGNLSFQVHPLPEYIQEHFGMHYTQDESYYLLDAAEDACVYLGLTEGMRPGEMIADLRKAQAGGFEFPAEKYVNKWPARKHDHFLIPAGTPHCAGRNSLVLEISATPYIFTFKMWDWGRLGLDGLPRPIHLEHGVNNIQWNRTTSWVARNLINRITLVQQGDGWREEQTGLHEREFIETRRHWFTKRVLHDTHGGVNVLNLCEGEEAIVESPASSFPSLVIHYAETFIVPASVGQYTIRPHGPSSGKQCATIKAYVRTGS